MATLPVPVLSEHESRDQRVIESLLLSWTKYVESRGVISLVAILTLWVVQAYHVDTGVCVPALRQNHLNVGEELLMQSTKLPVDRRFELTLSDEEIAVLSAITAPPEAVAFFRALFDIQAPEKPVCFGDKESLDIRTDPCATCALSRDCAIDATTRPVE